MCSKYVAELYFLLYQCVFRVVDITVRVLHIPIRASLDAIQSLPLTKVTMTMKWKMAVSMVDKPKVSANCFHHLLSCQPKIAIWGSMKHVA